MKYRLYRWIYGYREWLQGIGSTRQDDPFTTCKQLALVVSPEMAAIWPDLEREELSEAELMERSGAAKLPGMEEV